MIYGSHKRNVDYAKAAKAAIECRKRFLNSPRDLWLECLKTGLVPWWAQDMWKEGAR